MEILIQFVIEYFMGLPWLCPWFLWADDGMQAQFPVHIFMDCCLAVAVPPALQIGSHTAVPVYFMGWFLGGLDGFLYALLMFVVIDYATGLMAAFVQKKVSSEVGFKGICKKVAIFCLVGIGHVLDIQVIQNGSVLRTAVIFFYLSNEGISIIENVALIGLPVPKKLKEVLEQLHEGADEKKEDE